MVIFETETVVEAAAAVAVRTSLANFGTPSNKKVEEFYLCVEL